VARLRSLQGRVVFVTGASSGIGRALALEAARRGAKLALVARRKTMLDEVASAVRALGGDALVLACDVKDRSAVAEAIATAERDLGPIHLGVVNAGFGRHRMLVEHELDDAEEMVRVNVLGALYVAQPLARAMVDRGEGHLVFMASIAGLVPVPGEAVYSATKFAMVGLSESLSIEVEPFGVHVLTVCPGAVRTAFVPEDERDRMPEAAHRTMIEPEEVALATFRALEKGQTRVVVPASLNIAVAARGVFASAVREGTARATRPVLDRVRKTLRRDRD
jgi:uncharacterized protein